MNTAKVLVPTTINSPRGADWAASIFGAIILLLSRQRAGVTALPLDAGGKPLPVVPSLRQIA